MANDDFIASALDRLQVAWMNGAAPVSLRSILQGIPHEKQRDCLLRLIAIDMEFRWNPRHRPNVREQGLAEAYRREFPDLLAGERFHQAIAAEYRIRSQHCDRISQDEYRARFPEEFSALRPLLDAVERESGLIPVGTRIGNYEILGKVARGGMGIVYKARQSGLDRLVALKMTRPSGFANDEERRRFLIEAKVAGQLDHPHIVPVFEVGEYEGRPYFTMAFIEGRNLAQRANRQPLPPREAVDLLLPAVDAVAYAHQRGVIHRDLKPQNILVSNEGKVKVVDFGMARLVSADAGLTSGGDVLGTPSFMPPEQARGQLDRIGPRSDIYSLGATLYCLLTGRPPFQASTQLETLRLVVDQPVIPTTLAFCATPFSSSQSARASRSISSAVPSFAAIPRGNSTTIALTRQCGPRGAHGESALRSPIFRKATSDIWVGAGESRPV